MYKSLATLTYPFLKRLSRQLLLLLSALFCTYAAYTQKADSLRAKNTVLPIAFYLPETGFALGVTGISTFRLRGESASSRPSQIVYSAAYTFKNLYLFFVPYELYQNEGNTRIKGELGFYKYFYNFYGLGNQSQSEDLETYDVLFPRFDGNYSRAIAPNVFLGGGYTFDQFDITTIKTGGILDQQQPIGFEGGNKSNLYALFFVDTRDNVFAPDKGWYLEAIVQRSMPFLFSDFDYFKYELDCRYFHSLKDQWILASQLMVAWADESTPFFDLPYLSSPNFARGFNDRRYINHQLVNLQSELRYPIWNRFKGVAFLSLSHLPDGFENFFEGPLRWSYGLGLRFELDKKERTRLRLDVASGGGALNFYITANEAF